MGNQAAQASEAISQRDDKALLPDSYSEIKIKIEIILWSKLL